MPTVQFWGKTSFQFTTIQPENAITSKFNATFTLAHTLWNSLLDSHYTNIVFTDTFDLKAQADIVNGWSAYPKVVVICDVDNTIDQVKINIVINQFLDIALDFMSTFGGLYKNKKIVSHRPTGDVLN